MATKLTPKWFRKPESSEGDSVDSDWLINSKPKWRCSGLEFRRQNESWKVVGALSRPGSGRLSVSWLEYSGANALHETNDVVADCERGQDCLFLWRHESRQLSCFRP